MPATGGGLKRARAKASAESAARHIPPAGRCADRSATAAPRTARTRLRQRGPPPVGYSCPALDKLGQPMRQLVAALGQHVPMVEPAQHIKPRTRDQRLE